MNSATKISSKKLNNYHQNKVLGRTVNDISKATGQSPRQISYDIHDIVQVIQSSSEFQDAAETIVSLIPKSLQVYDDHLGDRGLPGNPDLLAARDVMKWIGIHVERTKHSGTINLNEMSNDDLLSFVLSAVKSGQAEDVKALEDKEISESADSEKGVP